ncbi:MAG TPA: MFS transporter [Phenylobacterium sp.]|uniref:MFS transporter n=1 Tax=Phenylobacterium sp. TaxID=1871053 RepID=UPI002B46FC12|nr:MFS transporter [Phenylobacterium sp.]HKR86835.1 MFS transporter [Phenylobacterium sp.]HKT53948.1 MFS transporter [Caulobacteraceae bacterium]
MEAPNQDHAHAAPMERQSAVVAATMLGVIAVLVFIIQPGYLQGLVDRAGLSGAQAGYVASSEMTGYAATMILFTFLSHRLPWRPLLSACILIEALGNAACLIHSTDPTWLAAARFLAGLGAGGLSSLSFTAIGMTKDPDREFGFLIMWILLYGAIGLWALPALFATIGLTGFYLIIVAVSLAAFWLVPLMPSHGDNLLHVPPETVTLSVLGRSLAVASIFVFFLGCGILWAYLSLIGTARGLSAQPVANALGVSQITGVAGALFAGLLGARFGRCRPLSASMVLCAASTLAVIGVTAKAALLFAVVVGLFNFGWNLAQPIYLSAATGFDRQGRLVPQMVAAQACGLALGPFLGAVIGGEQNVAVLATVVAALFLASVGLIAPSFREAAARRSATGFAVVAESA